MPEFSDFYSTYPRKIARKDAEKAWRGMRPAEQEAAIDALPAHCAYWTAQGTEKEFIPYPATWLRAARWEDEIEMPAPKQQKEVTVAWWSSDASMLAKGRELGTQPRPGEDWQQFNGRLISMMQNNRVAA